MTDLKENIHNGAKPVGTFVWDYSAPAVPMTLLQAGMDFVVLDNEHGHFSYETLLCMIQLAHSCGGDALVRAPGLTREAVQRYCDLGCDGLVFPMISTPRQASEAVRLSHYPPLGEKGMAFGKGNMRYRADGDGQSFIRQINQRLLLLCQIETVEGVANVEKILAVPGVDGVFIGPLDLSSAMNRLQQFEDAEFLETVARVMKAAKLAGKIVCSYAGDEKFAAFCRAHGCDMIVWKTESSLLFEAAGQAKKMLTEVMRIPG